MFQLFRTSQNLLLQIKKPMLQLPTQTSHQLMYVAMHGVPCIAMPLQNTRINVDHLTHLRDLQLAHPLTTETEFEISLLIGADHYWDIVGDRVVRGWDQQQ